jgi:hypothetical protein
VVGPDGRLPPTVARELLPRAGEARQLVRRHFPDLASRPCGSSVGSGHDRRGAGGPGEFVAGPRR